MARGGILKASLDAHKGKNYALERQKKFRKQAEKRKKLQAKDHELEGGDQVNGQDIATADKTGLEEEVEDVKMGEDEEGDWLSEDEDEEVDLAEIDDTDDSDSENDDMDDDIEEGDVSLEQTANGTKKASTQNGATAKLDEDDEEDGEEDIPFSDLASLDSDDRGDIVPHQRLTINNGPALLSALARIAPNTASIPFSFHMTVTSSTATSSNIKDIDDDLSRELAFYAQSIDAVKQARQLLKSEGVPFTRPNDYFAEMIKSEEHMGRVKQRLVDDAAAKKASSDARRQRDLKKFGKAVQVAKGQERDKLKRETMEKINSLKRKRSNALPNAENEADMFDIALDSETKRSRQSTGTGGGRFSKSDPGHKRQKKNDKYGFGGKKRHSKSGDAMSSAGIKKGKGIGSKKRLGKSRRAKAR